MLMRAGRYKPHPVFLPGAGEEDRGNVLGDQAGVRVLGFADCKWQQQFLPL